MQIRKSAWLLAVLAMPCLRLSALPSGEQPGNGALLVSLGKMLKEHHYNPKAINDRFSGQVWQAYLHMLDPLKNILLQSDIAALKRYEHLLDDEIEGRAPFEFLPAVTAIYQRRLAAALQTDSLICMQPFHFSSREQIHADGSTGNAYPANEAARKESRTRLLKYLALQYRYALKKGALADSSEVVLERASREKALMDVAARYHRLLETATIANLFTNFAAVICHEMDPHTDYFPPAAAPSASQDVVADRMKSNMLLGTAIIHRGNNVYGYICLPSFYLDTVRQFRCATDMAKAVAAMDSSQVDGLIIDLRNNPGGALLEVQAMAGLFVKGEGVVQLKGRNMAPALLKSTTPQPVYNGPLVVMVNNQTASAAELFTAAMQDYGRAVICGSRTFGKGTVQRSFPVNNSEGYMKITFEQLFRVTGSSTQLKGITPDILLPEIYKSGQVREAEKPAVLPWDTVAPASITRWPGAPDLPLLKEKAGKRPGDATLYAAITEKNNWLATHDTATVSLDVDNYLQLAAARQENINALNQLLKLPVNRQDQVSPASFSFLKEPATYQRWLALVQSDLFVNAAVNILADWVTQ